ncbi:hypothetical protein CLOM_g24228 [Closterium sp. NIES-68]|nr:hypothetical protein CLOM_g24228 [Closterium sp. NIES-68]GJP85512.1 hypothetical protein CLOP_g15603 [Closterium sp. NIES-67]
MERPAEEVGGAIHRIVQNADLALQAATIRRVFSPGAVLQQPLLACHSAQTIEHLFWLRSVTAIYWYFTVADVIYDVTRPDRLVVRGSLCVRPWLAPLTTRQLHMVAVLRLERHEEPLAWGDGSNAAAAAAASKPGRAAAEGGSGTGGGAGNVSGSGSGGRAVWRIAEQSNFFQVDPLVAELPVIGALYAWSARLALLPTVLSRAMGAANSVYRVGLPGFWLASSVLSAARQAVTSILHVVFWVPKHW